jgi:hypothetical protein
MNKKARAKELGITLQELENKENTSEPQKFGKKKAKKDFDIVIKMKDEHGEILNFSEEPIEETKVVMIEAENTLEMIEKALGVAPAGPKKKAAKKKVMKKKVEVDKL